MPTSSKQITIDMAHVEKGVANINKFADSFVKEVKIARQESAQRLREKAIENLGNYGLGDSSLVKTIYTAKTKSGYNIGSNSPHADYVEFGTGIVGSQNPHPHPWAYDVNGHGDAGWAYYDGNRRLHFTRGMPSRHFIYDTWLWANSAYGITRIIRKHLRRIGV